MAQKKEKLGTAACDPFADHCFLDCCRPLYSTQREDLTTSSTTSSDSTTAEQRQRNRSRTRFSLSLAAVCQSQTCIDNWLLKRRLQFCSINFAPCHFPIDIEYTPPRVPFLSRVFQIAEGAFECRLPLFQETLDSFWCVAVQCAPGQCCRILQMGVLWSTLCMSCSCATDAAERGEPRKR